MVIAVVIPSHESRSATNRDVAEANLYFPEGTEIEDIPILLVYNNDHHYVVLVYNNGHHYVGTRSIKKNFKDGIDSLSEMLRDCRILGWQNSSVGNASDLVMHC